MSESLDEQLSEIARSYRELMEQRAGLLRRFRELAETAIVPVFERVIESQPLLDLRESGIYIKRATTMSTDRPGIELYVQSPTNGRFDLAMHGDLADYRYQLLYWLDFASACVVQEMKTSETDHRKIPIEALNQESVKAAVATFLRLALSA